MSRYTVSIVRGEDVYRQVSQAIELIGGISAFVNPQSRVLIKPNMTGPATYEKGVTTNPAVIEALVRLAYGAGAKQVDIGDGTGSIHIGSIRVMEICGMQNIVDRYGGNLIDLNCGKTEEKVIKDGYILKQVKVSKAFLDYDTVINVPVMKTHFITDVSLGMKNMKGCIPPKEKRRFHDVGVNMAVADLNTAVSCHLTVMDGTVAGEGLGPKEGKAVGFKTVIAGDNVLAVDMVSAAVMGFCTEEVEHIRMAKERGIGPGNINEIEVAGCSMEEVKREFLRALPSVPELKQAEIKNYQSCSGCMGCAAIAISRLQDMGFFKENQERKIILVTGTKVPEHMAENPDTFLIGNCAAGTYVGANCMQGCAPSALDTANMILDYYEISHRPYV